MATTDVASYTVVGSDTSTDICNGLRADFSAADGDFSVTGTTTIIITPDNTHATVAGQVFGIVASDNLSIAETTTVGDLTQDLDDINEYDPDWYGLCLDSNSPATRPALMKDRQNSGGDPAGQEKDGKETHRVAISLTSTPRPNERGDFGA